MKREGEVIFTLGNDAMTAGAIAAGANYEIGRASCRERV